MSSVVEQFIKVGILLGCIGCWIAVLFHAIKNNISKSHSYSIEKIQKLYVDRKVNIILFGDSLVQKPIEHQKFMELLYEKFPENLFTFTNSGKNGQKIKELRQRLYTDVISHRPDGVFLFWDSDVSSSENTVDHLLKESTQTKYEEDLRFVVSSLRGNISFVIVGGPILMGEGPWLQPRRFFGRSKVLTLYSNINSRVCVSENVTFLNLRKAFLDNIPKPFLLNGGFLTNDGEHGNTRGTKIIIDAVSNALSDWLRSLY